MKWKKGINPKKTKFVGIIGSKRYLVRFINNQIGIYHWLGDRWNNLHNGGNIITHYMLIDKVKEK